jgi:hypothetical protein
MTAVTVPTPRRGARTPSYIYLVLAAVLVVLIATVAVTTASSAPPSIAEYSPQSIQQIKKAPNNQSGSFGNPGGDGLPGGSPSPTPSASTPPAALPPPVNREHECVGFPPRQTEDPQSPPCVAGWQGNNGGATTKGVSGTEIRVYMPAAPLDPEGVYPRVVSDLQTFFNRRFEFYGRQLNLAANSTDGSKRPTKGDNCADIQVQADWVVREVNAFAATDSGSDSCWYAQLARGKVISIAAQTTTNNTEQQQLAPFLWSYPMEGEELMQNTGEFICSQLGAGPASYSQDPTLNKKPRVYGLINSITLSQFATNDSRLRAAMAQCGLSLKKSIVLEANDGQSDGATKSAQNAVLQMRAAGVTTMICFCQLSAQISISANLTTQGYKPEIIAERADQNILADGWTANQRRAMLEVSGMPMQIDPQRTAFFEALNDVDPGFCPCSNSVSFLYGYLAYKELLLLSSGIQMAGPTLTPTTFSNQLHATEFPNAPSTTYPGHVGFEGNRHAMITDVTVGWFNDGAQSPTADPAGAWCYAFRGKRITTGHWPTYKFLPPNLADAPCYTGRGS